MNKNIKSYSSFQLLYSKFMIGRQWNFLREKFEKGQLAHAYLFSGLDQAGIKSFTREFLQYIHCYNSKKPCKECSQCKAIQSGNFPDVMTVMVSREEEGRNANEITIQQIREAQQFLSYKPFYNLMKIVIVQNAEKMTLEAQNCFLKTLEEPKGRTIIFLITPKPDLLLPTVSSRCQEIKFFYKGKHEILKEEEIIFNDLMKIIKSELAEKFRYAKNVNLEGENFNKVISVLRKYFRQMMLSKVGLTKSEVKNYSVEKLRKIIDLIEDISRQSVSGNINNKMALEILLMET